MSKEEHRCCWTELIMGLDLICFDLVVLRNKKLRKTEPINSEKLSRKILAESWKLKFDIYIFSFLFPIFSLSLTVISESGSNIVFCSFFLLNLLRHCWTHFKTLFHERLRSNKESIRRGFPLLQSKHLGTFWMHLAVLSFFLLFYSQLSTRQNKPVFPHSSWVVGCSNLEEKIWNCIEVLTLGDSWTPCVLMKQMLFCVSIHF